MRHFFQKKIGSITRWLELVLGFILAIIVVLLVLRYFAVHLPYILEGNLDLTSIMGFFLEIAVALEFIKMLAQQTPETVIEVLLFAISKELIIKQTTQLENLAGIACIAALFATRKFLFFKSDETERIVMRASSTVASANRLADVHIPASADATLGEVVADAVVKSGHTISIGALAEFEDCALRVDSIHDKKITRVEIISFQRQEEN